MFSQAELKTILSISIVLLFLAASINIYWILSSSQIETIRRIFAQRVGCQDHRIESYIKGLRELADE